MKNIVILIVFIMTALSASGQCFNIHKMIEASGLYRSKLDFSKEVVLKKGDIHVYKDFVLIAEMDNAIIRKISKGQNLSDLKELLEIDILDYYYTEENGIPYSEIRSLRDSISLPNTFFFYAFYGQEYIIFSEINFRSIEWENDEFWEEISKFDLKGFEISDFPARVRFYTFKCGELGELIHIRTDQYATFCW